MAQPKPRSGGNPVNHRLIIVTRIHTKLAPVMALADQDGRAWTRPLLAEGMRSRERGRIRCSSLTDVLVSQFVREPNALRLMLDRLAVDDGAFELLDNAAMDSVTLDKGKKTTFSRQRCLRL